jgi:hypothetical protein
MLMAVVQTTKRFKEMYLGHVRLNKVKPFFLLAGLLRAFILLMFITNLQKLGV